MRRPSAYEIWRRVRWPIAASCPRCHAGCRRCAVSWPVRRLLTSELNTIPTLTHVGAPGAIAIASGDKTSRPRWQIGLTDPPAWALRLCLSDVTAWEDREHFAKLAYLPHLDPRFEQGHAGVAALPEGRRKRQAIGTSARLQPWGGLRRRPVPIGKDRGSAFGNLAADDEPLNL
jgi:hypothetical protein